MAFDPYHRWLGIPKSKQPADYYRLLGLDQFEEDVEVIRDAADRQIAFVRRHQNGDHKDAASTILNELAMAEVTLTDAKKRTAYDAELRSAADRGERCDAEQVPATLTELDLETAKSESSELVAEQRNCPSCSAPFLLKPQLIGKILQCPKCRHQFEGGQEEYEAKKLKANRAASAEAVSEGLGLVTEVPAPKSKQSSSVSSSVPLGFSDARDYSPKNRPEPSRPPSLKRPSPFGRRPESKASGRNLWIAIAGTVAGSILLITAIAIVSVLLVRRTIPDETVAKKQDTTASSEFGVAEVANPSGDVDFGSIEDSDAHTETQSDDLTVSEFGVAEVANLSGDLDFGSIEDSDAHAETQPADLTELLQMKLTVDISEGNLVNAVAEIRQGVLDSTGNKLPFKFDIFMMGVDLRRVGITQNQKVISFQIEAPLNEVLTALVVKANPDPNSAGPTDELNKLIWVVGPDPLQPDREVILITTRAAARRDKIQLPAALVARIDLEKTEKSNPATREEEISAKTEVPKTFTNSIGMKLNLIPAGKFVMGAPTKEWDQGSELAKFFRDQTAVGYGSAYVAVNDFPDEFKTSIQKGTFSRRWTANDEKKLYSLVHQSHDVTLTEQFYIGVHEVTQKQWKEVMSQSWAEEKDVKVGDNFPAPHVDWKSAKEFCRRLSRVENHKYRLPTEAEWEYACRGGTATMFSFGDSVSDLQKHGWFSTNADKAGQPYAHEVGQKLPNPFGLYDMHGNVSEWCEDDYSFTLYSKGTVEDPLFLKQGWRGNRVVLRGGNWKSESFLCRSAFRSYYERGQPKMDNFYTGFRVVMEAAD